MRMGTGSKPDPHSFQMKEIMTIFVGIFLPADISHGKLTMIILLLCHMISKIR